MERHMSRVIARTVSVVLTLLDERIPSGIGPEVEISLTARTRIDDLKQRLSHRGVTLVLEQLLEHPDDAIGRGLLRSELLSALEMDPQIGSFLGTWVARAKRSEGEGQEGAARVDTPAPNVDRFPAGTPTSGRHQEQGQQQQQQQRQHWQTQQQEPEAPRARVEPERPWPRGEESESDT